MSRKPKRFGREVIQSLAQALEDARAGKPFRQSVVRRMTVKGETVNARETFSAPIGTPPAKKEK